MKMNGKPKMIAIKIMANGGKEEGKGYKEPATPAADMEEDSAEGEDTTSYECPECGTTVEATMEKKSMKCPCCGSMMEKTED
jgi:DNA-directed RNA polymerase subunit RPC12/RpoP